MKTTTPKSHSQRVYRSKPDKTMIEVIDYTLGYMETTKGPLGFTIPLQTLSASQEVNMTPADIMAWRNRLPMADMGNTAKKVYHAISDCNKIELSLTNRFEILECLRPPTQFICQSLRKHYINPIGPLSQKQLTIANLAQTLQWEMANGYKLIIEAIDSAHAQALHANILITALQRTIHYFTHIILRDYQLYSHAPKRMWAELHLIYQYAKKNQLLTQNHLVNDYKRALLLAVAFPYQWRQSEQDAIYTATEVWGPLAVLRNDVPNASAPGFILIDVANDKPPVSPTRGLLPFSDSCQVLDVNPILNRLKTLLAEIEPNELQARIAHSNDVEYAIPSSVLAGLLKEWGAPIARNNDRTQKTEPVKICTGLMATHFYLNDQHPFQPQQISAEGDNFALALPTFSLENEGTSEATSPQNNDTLQISLSTPEPAKANTYPSYACTLENENANGYGLLWQEKIYPPMQAGEVIGIEKEENGNRIWEVCKVRWLQYQSADSCQIDVERLGKLAKAGAAQLVKEGQPAGYYLRCLLFESTILLPTLPFKRGSQVSIVTGNESAPAMSLELGPLIDATGSYKRFEFKVKQSSDINIQPATLNTPSIVSESIASDTSHADPAKDHPEDGKDGFGSVWSDL